MILTRNRCQVQKQRKLLLLLLSFFFVVITAATTLQAVTITTTGKVTNAIAWELIADSPSIAGDGPVFSGDLVSALDATRLFVARPPIQGGYGQDRRYRITVERSGGAAVSIRWSEEIPAVWDSLGQQTGTITPLYNNTLELVNQGVEYNFLDIVFQPRSKSVEYFAQYAINSVSIIDSGDSIIIFRVYDID